MSDPRTIRHEYRPLRQRSEALDDWENEGGSLRCSYGTGGTGNHPFSGQSVPDFALLDALPLGVLITDHNGYITYSNRACQHMYATAASSLLGIHWCQAIDARDQVHVPAQWRRHTSKDRPLKFEVRIVSESGQRIWTRHSIAILGDEQATAAHIHTIEDISRMHAAEKARMAALEDLSRERERARVTLESIGDAVISTDPQGKVTYLNTVAEQLTGWSREKASGQPLSQVFRVIDSNSGTSVQNPAERAMDSLEIVQMPANSLLLRPDGSELAIEDSAAPILDINDQLVGAVVIFRDRRLSRESTARMAYLARHDNLTGLPNRLAFAERCDQAIRLAGRHDRRVALLFIDADNFKQVNDSLGHKAGDRLLQDLSRKLAACVRSADLVCRHGGDEFVVLLSEIGYPEDARRVAMKMRAAAARPCRIQGRSVGLKLSIGISLFPDDGTDIEGLIHRADAAMYQAKLNNGKGYCFHQDGMERPAFRAHALIKRSM